MRNNSKHSRRHFLTTLAAGFLPNASCRVLQRSLSPRPLMQSDSIRFGLISDVHFNLHPKAYDRLAVFIAEMKKANVDFIIQLGDFCQGYNPADRGKFDPFMRLWNRFPGLKYHVLGNHDLDRCIKSDMVDYWQMPYHYYSFDVGAWHFIALDSNTLGFPDRFVEYENGNYYKHPENRSYLSPRQIEWLERDLAGTRKPTIVFSHRGLDTEYGVKDGAEARAVLENANRTAGFPKVVACFCGHYHLDGHMVVGGIPYIMINSAVYYWLGGKWKWIEYDRSLFGVVTLRPGLMEIQGRRANLVPVWPLGDPTAPDVGPEVTAAISDLRFRFQTAKS